MSEPVPPIGESHDPDDGVHGPSGIAHIAAQFEEIMAGPRPSPVDRRHGIIEFGSFQQPVGPSRMISQWIGQVRYGDAELFFQDLPAHRAFVEQAGVAAVVERYV